MTNRIARLASPSPYCPDHGIPRKRSTCLGCNAAYMRTYLWKRRQTEPDKELWRRAAKRASALSIPFSLPDSTLIIPERCPVLGIPLFVSGKRSAHSPSLDRIEPSLGYAEGNVRIISDKANRLKGAHSIEKLRSLARSSEGSLRLEYTLVVEYVDRELLLAKVFEKSTNGDAGWEEWSKVYRYLNKVFSRGTLTVHNDGVNCQGK